MAFQFTPYTPLLVLAGAISAALAAYGWRLRTSGEARWFVLMTAAAAGWSFGYAAELSATTLGATLFWERIVWALYALVIAGVLLFSLEFAGYEAHVTRRTLPLFFLPSALTTGLVFTTGTHGLVWSGAELVDAGGFVALRYGDVGPWYWIETAYGFGVCLLSIGLFVRQALVRRDLYRKQSLVMATGIGISTAAAGAYLAAASGPVDLTPLFFVPTGLLFAWGLVRYRMLDLLPVARDLAVEHMTDAVVVLDVSDRIVDFNPAATVLFGLDGDDLGADAATVLDAAANETNTLADGAELVHDGADERRYFEVDGVTIRDGRGDVRGRVCLLHDVSERRNRERWLRTLTENASDVVAVLSGDGTIRYGGQSVEARLGYEPAEIVGRDVTTLLHPDDRDRAQERFVDLLRDPGGQRNTEMQVRHADGSYHTFDVYWRNLLDDPAVEGVVLNAHDVTERKARERRLKRQNEQLDAFASIVSHDLRNPLNVASGFLDLARETGEPEHFDRVAEAHERMEEIVGDVLALARAGSELGDTEALSLEAVATDAWANVETPEVTLDVAGDATVEADRTTLLQLFENLFRNTVEHGSTSNRTESGDSVEQGSTDERSLPVRVGALREEGAIDGVVTGFFVEDDGPGIPEADRERVFDSGVTGAADGTGFGLAIVRSIAEAHGWTVEATDASGRTGVRFAFEFGSPVDVGDGPVGGTPGSAPTATSTAVDDQSM